jgi:nitrite reductase/ring-hydroxylating ferredoxin subunit
MAARERLICASDQLVDGGDGVRFDVEWMGTAEPAFAVRYGGSVYAYLNRCGHVPVEIDWQHGRFFDFTGLDLICTVHGALYDPRSGECLGGRCQGRGLRPLAVVEKDGGVFLIESE